MSVFEPINMYRGHHRREMIALLAEKTAYKFRFLGLKGLISNESGAFEFPYDARILHGLVSFFFFLWFCVIVANNAFIYAFNLDWY
jgi:hypothetical protein